MLGGRSKGRGVMIVRGCHATVAHVTCTRPPDRQSPMTSTWTNPTGSHAPMIESSNRYSALSPYPQVHLRRHLRLVTTYLTPENGFSGFRSSLNHPQHSTFEYSLPCLINPTANILLRERRTLPHRAYNLTEHLHMNRLFAMPR